MSQWFACPHEKNYDEKKMQSNDTEHSADGRKIEEHIKKNLPDARSVN